MTGQITRFIINTKIIGEYPYPYSVLVRCLRGVPGIVCHFRAVYFFTLFVRARFPFLGGRGHPESRHWIVFGQCPRDLRPSAAITSDTIGFVRENQYISAVHIPIIAQVSHRLSVTTYLHNDVENKTIFGFLMSFLRLRRYDDISSEIKFSSATSLNTVDHFDVQPSSWMPIEGGSIRGGGASALRGV